MNLVTLAVVAAKNSATLEIVITVKEYPIRERLINFKDYLVYNNSLTLVIRLSLSFYSPTFFAGMLLGIAIRTGSPLSLNLAEPMWKQLAGLPLGVSDLTEVDKDYVPGKLKEICSVKSPTSPVWQHGANSQRVMHNGCLRGLHKQIYHTACITFTIADTGQ